MIRSKAKIAVTGGTGHLGNAIVREILKRSYKVKALYHQRLPAFRHPDLEWVQGNLIDPMTVEKLMTGIDVVIHAAGVVDVDNSHRDLVLETNVLCTQNVVDYCTLLDRKVRLVHISSMNAVESKKGNSPVDEQGPYMKQVELAYSWSKSLSEQLVKAASENKKLDAIIVRPAGIIGAPDPKPSMFGNAIINLIEGDIPAIINGGYNFMDSRDAARSIANTIELNEGGKVYNLGGHYHTMTELISIVAEIIDIRAPKFILPVKRLRVFKSLICFIAKYRNIPYTAESLYFMQYGIKNIDSSKAIKDLDHKIRPIKETLEQVIEWYKQNGYLTKKDLNER